MLNDRAALDKGFDMLSPNGFWPVLSLSKGSTRTVF